MLSKSKIAFCLLVGSLFAQTACISQIDSFGNDPAKVSMPPASALPEKYKSEIEAAMQADDDGDQEKAKELLRAIIAQDPDCPEADFCRAEINLLDDKNEDALELYNKALAKNPRLEAAYNERSNAYRALEQWDKAISDCSVAMLLGPHPMHWVCRARAYTGKKEFRKAMEDLTVALSKNKDYDCAYEARAKVWEGLGQPEKAAPDYDRGLALTKEKNRPSYLCQRGNFFLKQNKPELARADFLAAANESKKPGGDYYYWLSLADQQLHNYDQALADLNIFKQKSREINDDKDVKIADSRAAKVRIAKYDYEHKPQQKSYQWAIACSAQLFSQNRKGLLSLAGEEPNATTIAKEKNLLQEWWGVDSRQSLLSTLDGQLNNGHDSLWREMIPMSKNPSTTLLALTSGFISNETAHRLALVQKFNDKFGGRGIMAWDLCRYICLCRWGYKVGYLTEDEAYERIMPVAKKLQQTYSSWQQMGEEYLAGRNFWSKSHYEKDKEYTDEILHDLLTEPDSPWVTLPWNTELK